MNSTLRLMTSVILGALIFSLSAPSAFAQDEFVPPPPGPIVLPVSITSNNSNTTLATAGDIVTLSFTVDVIPLVTPSAIIAGRTATVSGSANSWTAFTTMITTDTVGVVAFSAEVGNVTGTATTTINGTTDFSQVSFFIDTIAPVIEVHDDVTADATSASGASVAYADPTVTDANSTASVSCTPASGSVFPLGDTTVTCNASDPTGNAAESTTFVVRVVPVVPVADPVAGTYTSAQSVTLSAAGATNIRYTTDGSEPSCTSGETFSSAISVSTSQTIKALSCYMSGDIFIASSIASFEYVVNIPAPTPSGGGGGGGGGGSGGSLFPTAPVFGGQVLGASSSTTQSESGDSCSSDLLVTKYMRLGRVNDPEEVKKLQQFLNGEMGLTLPVDGFFGLSTDAAVRAFQEKYADEILAPWGITKPTGFVYLTTRHWINHIICASLDTPLPPLVPFSGQ